MFGQLIESRRRRTRRAGEAVLSVLAHGAIVGGAVILTATPGPATPAPDRPVPPIVYIPIDHPQPTRPVPSRPGGALRTHPDPLPNPVRYIAPPIDVPQTFPPVGGPVDAGDISFGPRIDVGTGVLGVPSSPSSGDGGALRAEFVDRVAELAGEVRPRYPDALRTAGVGGRVVVRFVVDTTGRVEPASVQLLAASHRDFEIAVRNVLPRLRFRAAEVGARKVRMLVEMPFEFALRDR